MTMNRAANFLLARDQNRWIRGFSRLGVVLGGLVALIGLLASGFAVMEVYNGANHEFDKLACLLRENDNASISAANYKQLADHSRCGFFPTFSETHSISWAGKSIGYDYGFVIRKSDAERIEAAASPLAVGLLITAVIAAALWGACYSLGWIFAGFS
jgi:hypothetical protein